MVEELKNKIREQLKIIEKRDIEDFILKRKIWFHHLRQFPCKNVIPFFLTYK